jgi:hypothetical protein
MGLYTQSSTTDLTAKGKRLSSIHILSTAGGVVQLKDGVGGTVRMTFNVGAGADKSQAWNAPALPVFPKGIQVVISGTDATATLDIL